MKQMDKDWWRELPSEVINFAFHIIFSGKYDDLTCKEAQELIEQKNLEHQEQGGRNEG